VLHAGKVDLHSGAACDDVVCGSPPVNLHALLLAAGRFCSSALLEACLPMVPPLHPLKVCMPFHHEDFPQASWLPSVQQVSMLLPPAHKLSIHTCALLVLVLQGSVQQQLEELCDRSPLCAPARLKRQKEVIKQLRMDNTILRLELELSKAQQKQHEGCAHCKHKA
jgi:hypothetical protein